MSYIYLLLVRCSDLSISAAHRERKATTSSVLNDSLPVHDLKMDIPDFQFFEIDTSENVGNPLPSLTPFLSGRLHSDNRSLAQGSSLVNESDAHSDDHLFKQGYGAFFLSYP